jgi:molybdopterin-guanine dinucleotide biosynthesis protein A
MSFSAVILTGGASSRMGADKATLDWNGLSAVDRLARVARALGAATVMTVGARAFDLPFVEEAGGGPVAGLAAGAARLDAGGRMLALAVDAPTVTPQDLAPLLAAATPGACYEDLHLPLAIDLAALPAEVGAGWSIYRLIEAVGLARLPCPPGAASRLRGANTPAERELLLAALIAAEGGRKARAGTGPA